jgi:uncharacterized membrane protein
LPLQLRENAMEDSNSAGRLLLPSFVIGVGLSGFFDGILLHQILQWHHLLSLVPGDTFRKVSTQILADGLFHVLMYLVTTAGLWLLWKRRDALREALASATLAAGALLGFGAWNIADVVLFHWIFGIHRIRVNVESPLTYDVAWLAILGLAPLLVGMLILRRRVIRAGTHGQTTGALIGLLALGGGAWSTLPQPGERSTLVVTAPGRSVDVLNSALASGARLKWLDSDAGILLITEMQPRMDAALYRTGALFVTRSPALAGCALAVA